LKEGGCVDHDLYTKQVLFGPELTGTDARGRGYT